MMCQIRKRPEPEDLAYSLYLNFLGLSSRNIFKAASRFIKWSHTTIRDWIEKYRDIRFYKVTYYLS
jgi:transposase-like protein